MFYFIHEEVWSKTEKLLLSKITKTMELNFKGTHFKSYARIRSDSVQNWKICTISAHNFQWKINWWLMSLHLPSKTVRQKEQRTLLRSHVMELLHCCLFSSSRAGGWQLTLLLLPVQDLNYGDPLVVKEFNVTWTETPFISHLFSAL
jgi:hypothetical protein